MESKPIEQRYTYVNNAKTKNQLIANAKKQMDYQKKEKIFKKMLKENGIPESQLKKYAKLLMELEADK